MNTEQSKAIPRRSKTNRAVPRVAKQQAPVLREENIEDFNKQHFGPINHEQEILKERERRKQLELKMAEIELKSQLRHELFEREKAELQSKRNEMLKKWKEMPSGDFTDHNDRARRRKWNKNSANDISGISSDISPYSNFQE